MCDLSKFYERTVETATGCYEWTGSRALNGYGRMNNRSVHRLVIEELVGPLSSTIAVMHTCDNPPCIRREHLRVGVALDNVRDMRQKGRARGSTLRGSQVGTSVLTEAQVAEIKARRRAGQFINVLAREFGVSKRTIDLIVTNRAWKHVA